MPNLPKDRTTAGARIPLRKLLLMVLLCPAFAALAAWELHEFIVHPDPSSPGEIWLALAMLLVFGVFTAMLPLILLANRRRPSQAGTRALSKTPQTLTINFPKRSPTRLLGFCVLFVVVGVLMSIAGSEGVGRRSTELFILGVLSAVFFALFILSHVLRRWKTRGVPWQIRIDADGIRDSRFGQHLIAWSDVASIRRGTTRGGHAFVAFRLRDPAAYRKGLDPFDRLWARFGAGSYSLVLSTLSEDEIVDALRAFKPEGVAMMGFPDVGAAEG